MQLLVDLLPHVRRDTIVERVRNLLETLFVTKRSSQASVHGTLRVMTTGQALSMYDSPSPPETPLSVSFKVFDKSFFGSFKSIDSFSFL